MTDPGGAPPGGTGQPAWYASATPAPPPPGAPFVPSKRPRRRRLRGVLASIAFLVVVVGVAGAMWLTGAGERPSKPDPSRANENPARRGDGEGGPTLDDHWHAAYGVFLCTGWKTDFPDVGPDAQGIHTHGDGLVHIHPFSETSAGPGATLGVFLDQIGLDFADDRLTMPDGKGFGTEGCDGQPTKLLVAVWPSADAAKPELYESGFEELRFLADGEVWAIAVVPEGGSLDEPPTVGNLQDPGDL